VVNTIPLKLALLSYNRLLIYSIENEFFLINNISLIDEFDEANAYVKETFGPSVDLVRVHLISTNND
jgi:hypothetical protein